MKRKAQSGAWEWLQPVEHWEAETREKASRRFFQIWNAIRGGGAHQRTDSFIKPNAPLRCTIWRASVRKFDEILADLILREKEGLLDTLIQGLEQIYPQIEAQAKSNPALLFDVNALLGKGRYEHEGLKPKLLTMKEEEEQREQSRAETPGRKKSPAEEVVRAFYAGLKAFPALQKKYLEAVTDIKFVDVEGKLGKGVAGYHTGTSYAGGRQRPNKLLTFFMMKDSYPYLKSRPAKPPAEIAKEFPNGNQPESPMEGVPVPGQKTFDAVQEYGLPGDATLYVQNQKNPDYDFITVDAHEAAKQADTRRKLQQQAIELQKQSMFENVYLAKNVLQDSPGFEDKKLVPGISLLALGREGKGYDVKDEERDLTQLQDGGLFWVPEKGLPKPEQPQPPAQNKFIWKGKEATLPPSKNLFAQSMEIIAQAVGMDDIWVDDKGNEYNSMEELLSKYEEQEIQEGLPHAKEIIKDILDKELSRGVKAPAPIPIPETEEVEEPVEEEVDVLQVPEYEEEPELALAAKQVIKLVRIANQLDNRGFSKEADLIDDIVKDIIKRSTRS
jgi:hypothetical protein